MNIHNNMMEYGFLINLILNCAGVGRRGEKPVVEREDFEGRVARLKGGRGKKEEDRRYLRKEGGRDTSREGKGPKGRKDLPELRR